MPVLRAFRDGFFSTLAHLRTVGALYLANLLVSLLLILPLAMLLDESIGHSEASGLASTFDLDFLIDFLNSNAAALRTYWIVVGYGAAAYLLLGSFLTGGVIDSLHSPGRSAYLSRFFGGCGKYFFRFLRLTPFALAALAALAWTNSRLNLLLERYFHGTTMEQEAFWAMRAKQVLLLALLMLLGAVLDTARIQAVFLGSTRMTARFIASLFFVLANLRRVFLLYALLALLGLAAFVPYFLIARALPAGSVLLLLLAQQAIIWFRMGMRVCTVASQMSLVQSSGEPPTAAAFASVLGRARRERVT